MCQARRVLARALAYLMGERAEGAHTFTDDGKHRRSKAPFPTLERSDANVQKHTHTLCP